MTGGDGASGISGRLETTAGIGRARALTTAAGLMLVTIACSTQGSPRTYLDEDPAARYYATQSGHILRVDRDGTVLNVTCLKPGLVKGLPPQELMKLPCESGRIEVLGKAAKIGDDWDMAAYAIAPETGTCRTLFPFFRNEWLEDHRHSCWNRLWEVPAAAIFYPVAAAGLIGAITSPIWVSILLL